MSFTHPLIVLQRYQLQEDVEMRSEASDGIAALVEEAGAAGEEPASSSGIHPDLGDLEGTLQ